MSGGQDSMGSKRSAGNSSSTRRFKVCWHNAYRKCVVKNVRKMKLYTGILHSEKVKGQNQRSLTNAAKLKRGEGETRLNKPV